MKAMVDKDLCIGCGLCESICPDVFKMDAGNKAMVLVDVIPQTAETCADDAMQGCPVTAITIE